jgi:hypothetical protein
MKTKVEVVILVHHHLVALVMIHVDQVDIDKQISVVVVVDV